MSTLAATGDGARRTFSGRRARLGDVVLQGVSGLAGLGAVVLLGLLTYKVVDGARLSLSTFGLGFLAHVGWDPVHSRFGAGSFLFGTVVTSIGALILATPLALGIVETLAAIPSVVIGLWGILVLGPVLHDHVMPALHSTLGFIPLFGRSTTGSTIFTAILVLTIMILPIVSSISRELFLGVPAELKEAALGLGTTRWEMVRGVVLPYTRGGVAAAMILGLGRALGEAIAVAQVIGAFNNGIGWNLFSSGNTLAAQIALEYQSASPGLETSSLFYLALILLVLSLLVNLLARLVVRRVARPQGLMSM